jgi:cytochrome b6-f complex iron-sulfur subunit
MTENVPAPQPEQKPQVVAAPAPAAKPTPAIAPITRSDFLWLGWTALIGFGGAFSAASARFFFPNVIYEPSQKFNAGPAKSYDVGVSTKWLNEQRVWIIRNELGFYVLWARCTHLGCTPNWFGDQNRFKCPCHGSNYTLAGDVIAGPAPKPLWRAKLELASTGDLIIDKAVLEDRPVLREKAPYFLEYKS